VLDFQRLGNDSRSDWLEQGLADLMIETMSSISPYLVIERRHLREILEEQRLAATGLVDADRAVGLIRFRGHLPKGGYDVPNGRFDATPAAAPAV
jgi:hypothetical protein